MILKSQLHYCARTFILVLGSWWLCLESPAIGNTAETVASETDLFSTGMIRNLKIQLDSAAMESLRKKPRDFVSVQVSDGTVVYPQVALHLKGSLGSFRPFDDKPAMTLDFSRFQTGRMFHGLRRIYLNNSVEDPSYVNEILGSEFFQAAGVPAPRVTRSLVQLNGGPARLYVLKEGFTEDFLAGHFHRISGELYEPDKGHDVNEKLSRNSVEASYDENQTALHLLSAAAQEPDLTLRWQKLENTLDMTRFIAFMAAEVMLGHRDGYCINRNNFRVYHDLDTGKILFFPHGMDQLLGTADLPWQPAWAGLVAQAVMSTPEGREEYSAAFSLMLTNEFIVEHLTNRVDELMDELRPVLDSNEFNKIKAAADIVKERIVKRKSSLLAQLNRPILKPLEFTADEAHPSGWEIAELPAHGTIDQTHIDGVAALHISASSAALASWRTTVLLPRGQYRFEDQVRVAGVEPLPYGTHPGARLRVSGNLNETDTLTGDSTWHELGCKFEVRQPMAKVDLICELRAGAGQVWFDLSVLRVLRIEQKHEN